MERQRGRTVRPATEQGACEKKLQKQRAKRFASVSRAGTAVTPCLVLAIRLVCDQVDQHEHDRRNTENPCKHVFAHVNLAMNVDDGNVSRTSTEDKLLSIGFLSVAGR